MTTIHIPKRQTIKKVIDLVQRQITYIVPTCEDRPIVIKMADLSDEIILQATLAGLGHKVGDSAAKDMGTPWATKYEAMKEVADRLQGPAGEWNKGERSSAGAEGGLLVSALLRLRNVQPTELDRIAAVKELVSGWDAKTQAAMRSNPQIAPIIATLRAERDAKAPKATIDVDALLADI